MSIIVVTQSELIAFRHKHVEKRGRLANASVSYDYSEKYGPTSHLENTLVI